MVYQFSFINPKVLHRHGHFDAIRKYDQSNGVTPLGRCAQRNLRLREISAVAAAKSVLKNWGWHLIHACNLESCHDGNLSRERGVSALASRSIT